MQYNNYFSSYSLDVYDVKDFQGKELLEESEIFTCNLEMPMLEEKESFYIEELNLLVKIEEKYRTSKENVVYYIESELIDDEETEKSKLGIEEAIFRKEEMKSKILKLEEKINTEQNRIKKFKTSFLGKFISI